MGNWPRLYGPLEIPYWPSITRHCSKHSVILQDKSFLLISLFPQSQGARLMSCIDLQFAALRWYGVILFCVSFFPSLCLLLSFIPSLSCPTDFSLEAYCVWMMMTCLETEEWRWTNFWAMECHLHAGSRGKVCKEEGLENWSKYLSEK